MSTRTRLTGTAKYAALAVVLLATFAHAAQHGHPPVSPADDGSGVVRGAHPSFKISGYIKDLYPGKTTKLVTTVRNPNSVPIRVTRIKAKVTGVAGCTAKRVKIKAFKGKRYVGVGHTATIKLDIRMRPKAPNACQGARLPLTYHGKAVRA